MLKKQMAVLLAVIFAAALFSAEKYAVLITGDYAVVPEGMEQCPNYKDEGIGEKYDFESFWNDTVLIWKMLIDLGYEDDNIYVLYADGEEFYLTDAGRYVDIRYRPQWLKLPPEFTITDGAATEANIRNAATELKSKMTEDDFLFVWTMSHSSGSSIYLLKDDLSGNRAVSFETFAVYFKPLNSLNKVYWLSMNNAEILSENLAQENVRFINSYEYFGIESKND